MNVKFRILGLLMMSAALFSACSSDDDDVAGGNDTETDGTTSATVLTYGVQKIPLVVTKGTTDVTVEYSSDGKTTRVTAPFKQTSSASNSSMVSGYVLLYSPTATNVTIYNGSKVVAENISLAGKTTTATQRALTKDASSTKKTAYFYVRKDVAVDESPQSSKLYYPQTAGGGSEKTDANKGEIETDLTKVSNAISWKGDDGKQYVYSSDGSATEGIIFQEVPSYFKGENFVKLLEQLKIDTKAADFNVDDYYIIWYVVKKQADDWHVDGAVVKKPQTEVTKDDDTPTGDDTKITHVTKPDADNNVSDGLYHNGGVMLYDGDGDKDYNDLVVDYDIEARFPKTGNKYTFPYIKIVMNLRAFSSASLDSVSINMDGLKDYVCKNDDMYITFQGVDKEKTPCTVGKVTIPDFSGSNCSLKASVTGNTAITASNLQWLLNNGNASGWYDLDANGFYNVTQQSFNGKPYATLSVMLYPKEGTEALTSAQIEETIDKIMDVAENSFTFNGKKGDYYIAPVGTAHAVEGSTLTEAFPKFPATEWWLAANADATKVVDPNKSYK